MGQVLVFMEMILLCYYFCSLLLIFYFILRFFEAQFQVMILEVDSSIFYLPPNCSIDYNCQLQDQVYHDLALSFHHLSLLDKQSLIQMFWLISCHLRYTAYTCHQHRTKYMQFSSLKLFPFLRNPLQVSCCSNSHMPKKQDQHLLHTLLGLQQLEL